MNRKRKVLIAAIFSGIVILATLGTWQLQRLYWKESLIADIGERKDQAPVSLADLERRWLRTSDVDYFPVSVEGRYQHELEQYYYTTHEGRVGWNVYTPLELDDGRVLFVNRGFVPDAMRDPATRLQGQVAGQQSITGLARNPLYEKPNSFMPDNEPLSQTYFWRSLDQMAVSAGLEGDRLVPYFVDAGNADLPGGFPQGGTTYISFPNNHLQYAITWYGLALALLGVGAYYLYTTRPLQAEMV
jgi:surfeit locus 1 family protein